MADESYSTKLAEGVYVRANDVLIHLNTANEDPGNGINLVPPVPVPEPPTGGGRVSLSITHAAFRRLCERVNAVQD